MNPKLEEIDDMIRRIKEYGVPTLGLNEEDFDNLWDGDTPDWPNEDEGEEDN